jgi:phospholipase/carboxylesterase
MAPELERRRGDPRLFRRVGGGAPRLRPGFYRLDVGSGREALLNVPAVEATPIPLAVMFHGAGGDPEHVLAMLVPLAEREGVAVLAPASLGTTWDAISGVFGADVSRIDEALSATFERCPIDDDRIAAGGFSDGASYALGLGLANGDLFSSIIAFSPGFIPEMEARGKPRVFVSHGTRDEILPVERCGRVVAEQLKRHHYPVVYREFHGPHTVPKPLAEEALRWFVKLD